MPLSTVLKGLYTYKNVVVYPWGVLKEGNLAKYFKFARYWSQVDRYQACK
jgi:hypothetical protein